MSKIISFRVPKGWGSYLSGIASQYHFTSKAELLSLVITEGGYLAGMQGIKYKKVMVTSPSEVLACRVPVEVYQAIGDISNKQLHDTPSVWASSVLYRWDEGFQKEKAKKEKGNLGSYFFRQDYAKDYRARVAVYRTKLGIKPQVRGHLNAHTEIDKQTAGVIQ